MKTSAASEGQRARCALAARECGRDGPTGPPAARKSECPIVPRRTRVHFYTQLYTDTPRS